MKKRDIFAEMMQGVDDMASQREGKITLCQIEAEQLPVPTISAKEIVSVRARLHMSQPVFASRIRTSIGTFKNREQARSKPNAQAALLIRLVDQFPDRVDRLGAV